MRLQPQNHNIGKLIYKCMVNFAEITLMMLQALWHGILLTACY